MGSKIREVQEDLESTERGMRNKYPKNSNSIDDLAAAAGVSMLPEIKKQHLKGYNSIQNSIERSSLKRGAMSNGASY